jgi:hypothetical protein
MGVMSKFVAEVGAKWISLGELYCDLASERFIESALLVDQNKLFKLALWIDSKMFDLKEAI